jgi:hypothetical protein
MLTLLGNLFSAGGVEALFASSKPFIFNFFMHADLLTVDIVG